MWMEIRFRPNGGGPWLPDTFREYVAKQSNGTAPPRLFWMNEEKRPLPGAPRITFVGSRRWVGLRVTGTESRDAAHDAVIALKQASLIARSLDSSFGGVHHVEIVEGDHSVSVGRETRYHIRKLVFPRNRSRSRYEQFLAALPPKGTGEVKAVQPEFLGILEDVVLSGVRDALPAHEALFVNGIKWIEPPRWGTPLTAGGELAFVAADLTFTLPHRISGAVQAGGLRTRGFGDIRLALGEERA